MEWKKPLEAAVAAAREAGEMLRREFYREGGPRGEFDHAEVDDKAERAIRERLRTAFPEFGFIGEESGRERGSDEDTWWTVDPNDGTVPFLQGLRGFSVSIGLIHRGQPVVGVVNAPCAPDNMGDLFAWGEGCGPLQRNGQDVPPPAWPQQLDSYSVALVSHNGDKAVAENLKCCAPARYRTTPSIAYRLALVAAGEGDVAVSINHPSVWDFAGGHALIRGAGGVLLDGSGQPVAYHNNLATVERIFGGAERLCRELSSRTWNDVFAPQEQAAEALPFPVRPPAAKPALPQDLLRRAQGCLLGQIAGDALGSLVEFRTPLEIMRSYPDGALDFQDGGTFNTIAGQPTDDSELALSLARALVLCGGFFPEQTFKAYRQWLYSEPFDVGRTIRQALSSGRNPQTRIASLESEANGALMRVSPIGIACWQSSDRAYRWALDDTTLTHPHPVCVEASQAYVQAIVAGLNGASPREMHMEGLKACGLRTREVVEAAAGWPPPDFMQHQGWVRIALHNAFYRLLHCSTLEEVIVQTVQAGGDTDTNAAIAGALAGAYFGRDALPTRWRKMILSCRPHPAFAACQKPRPRFCWPADALDLAESLLLL